MPASITKPAGAAAGAGPPAAKREPAPLHATFSKFVSTEKERLQQKREAVVKQAAKTEKDSKLASLLEFSQSFKVGVCRLCLLGSGGLG